MKKKRYGAGKVVATMLVTAGVVLSPVAANAIPKDGGEWYGGADAKSVWSQYQHNSRVHMAWVKNLSGRYESGRKAPGVLASVSRGASLWGNEAGWGF